MASQTTIRKRRGGENQSQKNVGQDCSQVKVEEKVEQQPTFKTNQTYPIKNGKPLKVTGVSGVIGFTVTVKGKPAEGVSISESNLVSVTKDSKLQPATVSESQAVTDADGRILDTFSTNEDTDGTKAKNDQIKANYSTHTWVVTGTQTLTLDFPNGGVCTATSTRTMTNAGPNGPSPKFKINTTQPVVTQPVAKPSN